MKGAWSGSRDIKKKIQTPFNTSGMDEATLFKFGKYKVDRLRQVPLQG